MLGFQIEKKNSKRIVEASLRLHLIFQYAMAMQQATWDSDIRVGLLLEKEIMWNRVVLNLKTPKSSNIGKVFALFVMRKPIVSGWGCPFPETPVIKSIWAHTHTYTVYIYTHIHIYIYIYNLGVSETGHPENGNFLGNFLGKCWTSLDVETPLWFKVPSHYHLVMTNIAMENHHL